MKQGAAFTLVEVLVVISIVIVLISIIAPVAGLVKSAARATSSVGQLRQVFLAASLYQQDSDFQMPYGTAPAMGLPTFSGWVQNWMNLDSELRVSPCRGMNPYRGFNTYLWAPDDSPEWSRLAQLYGDGMFMVQDRACNSAEIDVQSGYASKKGICVTLGGSIIQRTGIGDWSDPEWWGARKL